LRQAVVEGTRRKFWRGKGQRGARAGRGRRKWVVAGRDVEIRVAVMATWDGSRWGAEGCGKNGVGQLSIALVRGTHWRTLYQAQVQAASQVTGRGELGQERAGGLMLYKKAFLARKYKGWWWVAEPSP
jgi:hypothetical protein